MKLMTMFFIVFCFGLVDAQVAEYFIYPVVGDNESVVGVAGNVYNPRSHGWNTDGNWFGRDYTYCPLPKDNNPTECGCDNDNYRFHPGEDWNKNGTNTADANAPVYSVGTGMVVRRSDLNSFHPNGYVIILYELPQAIDFSGYFLTNPLTSNEYKNSKWVGFDYYHIIVNQSLHVGDRVVRGQKLGVIDPYNPSLANPTGPHLHFEGMVFTDQQVQQIFQGIQSGNISHIATSSRNCCGYYLNQQDITADGYINPTQFIADHVQPSSFSGLTYVNSWVCENWAVGSNSYDKDPINIRNTFEKDEYVCCLTELTNVSINHRFKVEAYCNGQKMWEFIDGWRTVVGTWGYSHFYPFWNGVPTGNDEFRVYIDINGNNSNNVDDWISIATKNFTVENNGTVHIAGGPDSTPDQPPSISPPYGLTAANVTGTIKVSWLENDTGTLFKIYRGLTGNFSDQTMISYQWGKIYYDRNITPGQAYYYRVTASRDSLVSDYSEVLAVTASVFPPPDNFRVAENDDNGVKLAWSKSPGTIYYYWIFRFLNGAQQWVEASYDTVFTDSTVEAGKTYTYKISAKGEAQSDVSEGVAATILPKKNYYFDCVFLPDADSNGYGEIAYLYRKGKDSIFVSVKDLGSGQILKLFPFGKASSPNSLAEINISGCQKIMVALDSIGTDKTTVRTVDAGLSSASFVLNAPLNFQAVSGSLDRIGLAWSNGNPEITGGLTYRLYSSSTGNFSSANLAAEISETSYARIGLIPGDSLFYWLKAVSGTEESPLAGPILAATNPLLPPDYLSGIEISDSRAVISWAEVYRAEGYRIYRDSILIGNSLTNYFSDFNVMPNNQYHYRVSSVFGNVISPLSGELIVSIPFLPAIYSLKNFKDAEYLSDLDGDGRPEMAALGIDSVSNSPVVYIKGNAGSYALKAIPFFSPGSVPISFSSIPDLDNDGKPEFMVLGSENDSLKIETRSFFGNLMP
jgi:murein DD-endopeptidase MepM/ murein hydrolase activator NlpD